MNRELSGVFPILVTPLDEKRKLDLPSLKNLVRYYLSANVDGLTVLGEVSESDKLSERERNQILETVIQEIDGKVPIVVGTSRESTELAMEAAIWAQDHGAAALMIAPPKNPKLREGAIFDYYAAIGESVSIPIFVQDEPESNHPYLSVDLLSRINKEVRPAKYLKLEEPPTPVKLAKVKELTNGQMGIFGASHGRYILWEMRSGAAGIMTASPTPEYLVAIWKAFKSGNVEQAANIFFYNVPLTHFYGDAPVPVKKEILKSREVISTARMKGPSGEMGEKAKKDLTELLHWVEKNVEKVSGVEPLKFVQ